VHECTSDTVEVISGAAFAFSRLSNADVLLNLW